MYFFLFVLLTHTVCVCAKELLLPPQIISATVEDGNLVVQWDLPKSRVTTKEKCFDYQLDMGDKVQNVCV